MNIRIIQSVAVVALVFAVGQSAPAFSQTCETAENPYFCRAGYRCCPSSQYRYYCKGYTGSDPEERARSRRVAPHAFCVNPDSPLFQDLKKHCRVFGHC